MKVLGHVVLFLATLAVAAAALVHTASEAGVSSPLTSSLRSSLNAEMMARMVDRGFKLELSKNATQRQGEVERLPDPLIALARRSFAVDPLEVSTIRTLALGSVLQEDEARGRELMRVASQISKRDAVTDLWLAQDYGRRGNVEAMTAAFDHALRTSKRAREAAIGPLVKLLANESSHAPIGKLLDRRPEWESAFWLQFARDPVALQSSAKFFSATSLPLDRLEPAVRAQLYTNLRAAGHFDALYRLAALDPGLEPSTAELAEGAFITVEDGHPLGWVLRSRGNYSSQVHPTSGELQIDAKAGAFGVAAERVIRLEGSRSLTILLAEPLPENTELTLAASCAPDRARKLGNLTLEAGDRRGQLDLPIADCDVATLQLSFAVDPGRRDALIRILRIAPDTS